MTKLTLRIRILILMSISAVLSCNEATIKGEAGALEDFSIVDSTLASFVTENRALGASILIYHNGQEKHFASVGLRDREMNKAWSRDTLVNIYSMTKPVTSVVLMTLYEEGLFALDDPLAKYLPEFENVAVFTSQSDDGQLNTEPSKRPIQIIDLMRHTAGLVYDWEDSPVGEAMRALDPFNTEKPLRILSREVATLPLNYQPGEQWLYSVSVDIQARLAEVLAGKPYLQLVQDRVFLPLGMTDTGYFVPPDQKHRLSAVYLKQEDGSFEREPDSNVYGFYSTAPIQINGGHGIVSTLDDYMRFALMLQNEGELDGIRILKSSTIELMASNHLPANITEKSWLPSKGQMGFGLNVAVRIAEPVDDEENYGTVGEFFWDGRASTLYWVDPKQDVTVVFYTQVVPFDNSLHRDIRRAVYRSLNIIQ